MCFSTPQTPLRCFHFSFFPLFALLHPLEFQGELTLPLGGIHRKALSLRGPHCACDPAGRGPWSPLAVTAASWGARHCLGPWSRVRGPARTPRASTVGARCFISLEGCSLGVFVLTLLVIWSVLRRFTE